MTTPVVPPKNKPLQFKRGTKKAFEKANLILLDGQPAFEVDTGKLKIGDGYTRYLNLNYIGGGSGGSGSDGKSAYEIWLEAGHSGTIYDFLESLEGKSAYRVWLDLGNRGTEEDFIKTLNGKSAYRVWLDLGNRGTEEDFINSLKGKSVYQVWLDSGNEGTEQDFIKTLNGKSAFEEWKEKSGTEDSTFEDFIESMKTISWGEF